ncbi:MAG: hypothetical protein LBJ10_08725 [Clostridiales bacterium]|jgi:hypothetical protein|nr:hypothetical protein [Clostridiales bacterium]
MNNPIFVYGTGNPAKLCHMVRMLAPLPVNIIGAKETGATLPDVDENGNAPLENARIRALSYYEALRGRRAVRGFGVGTAQCGKCIEACPWPQRYLSEDGEDA